MTYVVQMQVLGTMQWLVLVAGVRDTTYTVHGLTKGAQYLFRVITATPKTNSKPSPPVGPVQLLDRGEKGSGEGTVAGVVRVSVSGGAVSWPELGNMGSRGGGDNLCGRSLPGRGSGHPGQARHGVCSGGPASLHHHHHQPRGGHRYLEEVGHGTVHIACPMPSIIPCVAKGALSPAPYAARGAWGVLPWSLAGCAPKGDVQGCADLHGEGFWGGRVLSVWC